MKTERANAGITAAQELPTSPFPLPTSVNPWIIALTVTLATFMELLDTSIANVALPHISGGLAAGQDESTWVLTSYLVANAVVLPLSAWLSRVFGRRNYYLGCVAGFTVASFLCGVAPSLGWLIAFRVLQGVAGGGLAPCEQAILVDTFPAAKRAAAFAVYSIAIVLAPALGPSLGGWITDNFSWRWIFFINLPIGFLSMFLTSQLVTDPPEFTRERRTMRATGKLSIDYIGIALVALGFGCLEVVLDKGQREDWFESRFILIFTAIAAVALVAMVVWEWRHPDPVVELRLLKERNFALANAFYFLFGFILFGATVLQPLMLQTLFNYNATSAGFTMTPGALVVVCLVPFVVKLIPKVGAKWLVMFGFFMLGVAVWHYFHLSLDATFGDAVRARMLFGFGLAFLFVPTSQVAYSYLPKEKNNKASSLTNLFRNQGSSFGISFVTTWLERRQQFHHSVLAEHVSAYDSLAQSRVAGLTTTLARAGYTLPEAKVRAQAMLAGMVNQQSAIQAFLDCFLVLTIPAALGVGLALFIKRWNPAGGAGSGGGH